MNDSIYDLKIISYRGIVGVLLPFTHLSDAYIKYSQLKYDDYHEDYLNNRLFI